MRAFALVFWVSLSGCGSARPASTAEPTPGLVFPAHFGEGENEAEAKRQSAEKPKPSASAKPAPPPQGSLPDPEPQRQAQQYEYEIVYERGALRVETVRAVTFPQPIVSARRMGRFALELWIGRELLERVRFDFPLLQAEEPNAAGPKPLAAAPELGAGVTARQKVLLPALERARRALLIDRATGETKVLPWPPDRPAEVHESTPKPPAPDAGS